MLRYEFPAAHEAGMGGMQKLSLLPALYAGVPPFEVEYEIEVNFWFPGEPGI